MTHTVVESDTLYNISNRYGVTVPQLQYWNGLVDNHIEIGQKLVVSAKTGKFYLNKENALCGRIKWNDLPEDHKENGIILIDRVNRFFNLIGVEPKKLNDGYRTPKEKYGAPDSAHRELAAVDYDDDQKGTLWLSIFRNLPMAKYIGLWFEHPGYTHYVKEDGEKSWVHIQSKPPKSGKRIFIPNEDPCPNQGFDLLYNKNLDGFI